MLALALTLAGCLGATETVPDTVDPGVLPAPAERARTHVLQNATEPTEFYAPTFSLLGAVGRGGPAYGAGEPSIWAHLDGTLFVAFPGCDRGGYLVAAPGDEACEHGPIYKSTDDGASWTRLNRDGDGRLTEEGPAANGDNDVTVDAAGTIYASNLGGGIQVFRSMDGGANWTYLGNATPPGHWADRQWMAAGAPGHLIVTWMGGNYEDDDVPERGVAINTTFDGGETWSGTTYVGEDIGWLGTVQFDPSGERAFIPFTQAHGDAGPLPTDYGTFDLLVARSLDGGRSWDVVDTGVDVETSDTGLHWSGVLMAPALDVTGDGTVVVAWSEEDVDPAGATGMGATVKLVASDDWGRNWSEPYTVSDRASAIMPWVTGGAGDRVAITYFASDVPLDSDYVADTWDVMAVVVGSAGADNTRKARQVVDHDVHVGGLCARGSLCLITGSDRALLDFFESDLLPDGRLAVTYPADFRTGGKYIEIRVAIQDGGTPLMLPPGSAGQSADAAHS